MKFKDLKIGMSVIAIDSWLPNDDEKLNTKKGEVLVVKDFDKYHENTDGADSLTRVFSECGRQVYIDLIEPLPKEETLIHERVGDLERTYSVLSKRELIAAMALQGILSSPLGSDQCPIKLDIEQDGETYCKGMAEGAVMYADALIAALAKEPKNES